MSNTHVECIVFRKINESIEFLLLKRVSSKGGFWQPVTGKVEKTDKSLLEASFRELNEEIGISKKDIFAVLEGVHSFEMTQHYITKKPISSVKEFVFGFEINPKFIISINGNVCNEHDDFKWVSFQESLKLLKWSNNKEAFIKLNNILEKH